jgi:hypothetical protein
VPEFVNPTCASNNPGAKNDARVAGQPSPRGLRKMKTVTNREKPS